MSNTLATIVASVLISVVLGAGIAFVALPAVYPSLESKTTEQKGTVQTKLKTWQDESYLFDNDMSWKMMNQTQMSFTIGNNSQILASFSAPFLLSLYSTFTGLSEYKIALVIQGVGNTSTVIVYYNGASSLGQTQQMSYFPTLSFMTNALPAGTYNCSVQWKSMSSQSGNGSNLSVSHHNTNSTYHYDRWMKLEEIKN